MKKLGFSFLVAGLLLLIFAYGVFAAPPSDEFTLVYSDEFDADELNLDDWEHRLGTKMEGVNLPCNVFLENGKLKIKFDKEMVGGKPTYTGGGIISNTLFGYGYYEVQSKLYGETGGLHSSFWTAGGNESDGVKLPLYNGIMEIDIYEQDSNKPHILAPNIHYWIGTHLTDSKNKIPYDTFDSSKEEFVVGLLYMPNRLEWYINGKLTTTVDDPKLFAPQRVWITALANTQLSGAIDDALLPGYSEWDYFRFYTIPLKGTNLIANEGFELNEKPYYQKTYPLQTPVAWLESGDKDASFVVYDEEVYEKSAYLLHKSNKPYEVKTFQKLTHISNGSYTLGAYVRTTGKGSSIMYANDRRFEIKGEWDKWTKIEIENIIVDENYCEVGFESNGSAEWMLAVDSVSFMLTDEGTDEYNIKSEPDFGFKFYHGEVLVDDKDAECQFIGKWTESTVVKGYKGNSKYSNDAGAQVIYTIPIENDGEYVVEVYKLFYANSDTAATASVKHADGIYEKKINMAEGQSEWVNLGSFKFNKPDGVSVTIKRANAYLRADCVRVIPKLSYEFDNAIVLKIGDRKALVNNQTAYIDNADLKVVPEIENSKTMVPLRFIAESLGAFVNYDNDTQTIDISLDGRNISLVIGSNSMCVDGVDIALEAPPIVKNARTLVPVRAVSEAFGNFVYWSKNEHILITDEDISNTAGLDGYLNERL